jgi:hypothetical protein
MVAAIAELCGELDGVFQRHGGALCQVGQGGVGGIADQHGVDRFDQPSKGSRSAADQASQLAGSRSSALAVRSRMPTGKADRTWPRVASAFQPSTGAAPATEATMLMRLAAGDGIGDGVRAG